jgi:hypothetical protein
MKQKLTKQIIHHTKNSVHWKESGYLPLQTFSTS